MINIEKLLESADAARKNSHSPYSEYRVGAALLCDDGDVYCGCNIENSSYSATVCAERVVFFKAIADGKRKFSKLALAAGKNAELDKNAIPCGVCLQVMSEFCDKNFEIFIKTESGYNKYLLSELLPHAFSIKR